jgi:hypothetical protein
MIKCNIKYSIKRNMKQSDSNHFFFFFFLLAASFSILMISFCFWSSFALTNSSHSSSNCIFLVFMFKSIASLLSFLVCLLSNNTPEISSYRLIRFLSMNSIYRSSSCYCLFLMSWSWMAITSSIFISGLFSMSSLPII